MDLGGISANDYAAVIAQNSGNKVTEKIDDIKINGSTDEEKLNACKEFEQYMIEQIYKNMEKTIDRAEEKSDYEEYFGDMMVEKYAEQAMEQGGMGLAQQLFEAMKHTEGDIVFTNTQ